MQRSRIAFLGLLVATGCLSCRRDPKQGSSEGSSAAGVEPMKEWTTLTERFSAPAMTVFHLQADDRALYWVSCPSVGGSCTLVRLAHDATKPEELLVRPSIRAYALDGDSIYAAAGGQIVRVLKTGGAAVVISDGAPMTDLQAQGAFLYVSVGDTRNMEGKSPDPHPGRILRVSKSGGSPSVLGEADSARPLMVLDERRIYFTGNQGILSMPIEGGATKELAGDERNPPGSLALDDDAVYFSAGGEVRRVPKSGGTVTVLYRAQIILDVRTKNGLLYAARNLAYDRRVVVETGAIMRIPSSGGGAEVVADLTASPQSLAVDASGVYAVLRPLGGGSDLDRVVAYPAGR